MFALYYFLYYISIMKQTKSEIMTHTKGKWNVKQEGGINLLEIHTDEKPSRSIAQLNPYHGHNGPESFLYEERQANAKLIAAAPELLAACQMAKEEFTSGS